MLQQLRLLRDTLVTKAFHCIFIALFAHSRFSLWMTTGFTKRWNRYAERHGLVIRGPGQEVGVDQASH